MAQRVPTNVALRVGHTPIIELTKMGADGVELLAKLEAFNPGGSAKDRIGVSMIEAAEHDGLIEPGRTRIVEATSGNTGIALAFVCAAKGYDLVPTLPQGSHVRGERGKGPNGGIDSQGAIAVPSDPEEANHTARRLGHATFVRAGRGGAPVSGQTRSDSAAEFPANARNRETAAFPESLPDVGVSSERAVARPPREPLVRGYATTAPGRCG